MTDMANPLSALLSAHHRAEIARGREGGQIPSSLTLAPERGGPGPGGALPGHPIGHGSQLEPDGYPLITPATLEALAGSVYNLEAHIAEVAARARSWPACDWHVIDRVILSPNPSPDGYALKGNPVTVLGRKPFRRLTVYNPNPATVYLGPSLAEGTPIPAYSVTTLPGNSDNYIVSTDPAVLSFDFLPILVVRSDRETDEITSSRLGYVAGYSPGLSSIQGSAPLAPLAANAVFTTGPIPGAPMHASVRYLAYSDVAGANVFIDGWLAGAWRSLAAAGVAIPAGGIGLFNSITVPAWYRIRIVNGATPMAVFDLQYWSVPLS